jgi:hypothetical protein
MFKFDKGGCSTYCTKHINIAYHWIREEVQKQAIIPDYVPSE